MVRNRSELDREQQLGAVYLLVMTTMFASGIWAGVNYRGLYQDGTYYLFRVLESDWFYLVDPARTTVQVIRQAPLVLLSKFSKVSLLPLVQVFSLTMLLAPVLITALCWFIAPIGKKIWTLFPAICLLVGFGTSTFEAVGEGAIAAAYFWILLFWFLFRTSKLGGQAIFLLLCGPAYWLHEALALLMPIIILAATLQWRHAATPTRRIFLALAMLVSGIIVVHGLQWIIVPRVPGDREAALNGLITLGFVYSHGRLNMPAVSALAAAAALCATFFFYAVASSFQRYARAIAALFLLFEVLASIAVLTTSVMWSPQAQAQARYDPIMASIFLAVVVVCAINCTDEFRWARGPTLVIVSSLALTQMIADFAMTAHWRDYVRDFHGRLRTATGLVPWAVAANSGDRVRDDSFIMITPDWTAPLLSIIFAERGNVRAIFNYPTGTPFLPFDPENLHMLPRMRGASYTAYQEAMESAR